MDLFYIILIGAGGLCIGSFFNVLIFRIPRGESIVWPASHCTSCGHQLSALENIPVISYLFLRGKCRSCGKSISPVYPAIELLTALAAVFFWNAAGFNFDLPWFRNIVPILRYASLVLLIPISAIDIRHYIIPDRFTIPFLGLALALSFLPGQLSPLQSLLGMLAGGGTLFLLGLVGTFILKKGDAMGFGDVKLMAYLGALWGVKAVLLGMVFGAFLGSLTGGILILARKLDNDHRIPFGPFLGAGLVIAVFAGDWLLKAYLNLLGM